jgi:hypothetical protein
MSGLNTIAGDDEVRIRKVKIRTHVLFKHELDAHLLATLLKDVKQLFAPDAHKAVTA